MTADDSMLHEFMRERVEILDGVEAEILEMERVHDNDTLRSLFRSVHSLKGTFGFLGLGDLETAWQDAETLLDDVRARSASFSTALASELLVLVDRTRTYFDQRSAGGHVRSTDRSVSSEQSAD